MKVRSAIEPQEITVTATSVLVAKNVTPYEETMGDKTISGYEYDCEIYSKDEYLIHQQQQIASLAEELAAAKILLGVD